MALPEPARERLRRQLMVDEGLRLHPYRDTVGKLTVGIGRNLDDRGISAIEALFLLDNDINQTIREVEERYTWFNQLDPVRQTVILNMAFNLGIVGLSKFVNTLAAVERGDYAAAARGMLASKWAKQVKGRAIRLAIMMETGQWPQEDQRA